jgi:hypothetical protein
VESPSDRFIIASSRAGGEAPRQILMQDLDGGAGGIINLEQVKWLDGRLDFSRALDRVTLSDQPKGEYVSFDGRHPRA